MTTHTTDHGALVGLAGLHALTDEAFARVVVENPQSRKVY